LNPANSVSPALIHSEKKFSKDAYFLVKKNIFSSVDKSASKKQHFWKKKNFWFF